MKKRFLTYSTGLIKKYYPETDDIKMEEYAYNLEGFYLTITKMLVIFPLAIIFGVIKELLIILLAFNILRAQAHGLHATKSWICLLSSSIVFILVPLIAKTIKIQFIYKIIINIIALYAPADTVKAPIIKAEKRKKYKINSIIYTLILIIISLLIKDSSISNLIIFTIWIEVFLILPITYKIFHLSYNNYIEYLKNMD